MKEAGFKLSEFVANEDPEWRSAVGARCRQVAGCEYVWPGARPPAKGTRTPRFERLALRPAASGRPGTAAGPPVTPPDPPVAGLAITACGLYRPGALFGHALVQPGELHGRLDPAGRSLLHTATRRNSPATRSSCGSCRRSCGWNGSTRSRSAATPGGRKCASVATRLAGSHLHRRRRRHVPAGLGRGPVGEQHEPPVEPALRHRDRAPVARSSTPRLAGRGPGLRPRLGRGIPPRHLAAAQPRHHRPDRERPLRRHPAAVAERPGQALVPAPAGHRAGPRVARPRRPGTVTQLGSLARRLGIEQRRSRRSARPPLERYLASLTRPARRPATPQREHVENLNGFLTALRQHEWAPACCPAWPP